MWVTCCTILTVPEAENGGRRKTRHIGAKRKPAESVTGKSAFSTIYIIVACANKWVRTSSSSLPAGRLGSSSSGSSADRPRCRKYSPPPPLPPWCRSWSGDNDVPPSSARSDAGTCCLLHRFAVPLLLLLITSPAVRLSIELSSSLSPPPSMTNMSLMFMSCARVCLPRATRTEVCV